MRKITNRVMSFTSQHYHESELGNDESLKKKKDKSISMFDSRIIYPDIDEPIAIRKSTRSCI